MEQYSNVGDVVVVDDEDDDDDNDDNYVGLLVQYTI